MESPFLSVSFPFRFSVILLLVHLESLCIPTKHHQVYLYDLHFLAMKLKFTLLPLGLDEWIGLFCYFLT